MRTHDTAGDDTEDADSFVERRLRERLKASEAALERVKERIAKEQKQHDELRTEARDQSVLRWGDPLEMWPR